MTLLHLDRGALANDGFQYSLILLKVLKKPDILRKMPMKMKTMKTMTAMKTMKMVVGQMRRTKTTKRRKIWKSWRRLNKNC